MVINHTLINKFQPSGKNTGHLRPFYNVQKLQKLFLKGGTKSVIILFLNLRFFSGLLIISFACKQMKLRRLNYIDYRWKRAIVAFLIPGTRTLFPAICRYLFL
jgi:hypothetical protein